jgi:hypothetical protein
MTGAGIMADARKILEKDLFKPVHDYFERLGYDVHGEVRGCYIAASKDGELIIIELKRSLNLELLIQAAKRQRITDRVYVAVPRPDCNMFSRKWKDLCFIVRRLELGLLTVSLKGDMESVDVIMDPHPFDRKKSMQQTKKKKAGIIDEMGGRHGNFNLGGSTRTKIMTAYKENSIHIACCLRRFGELSPKKLREMGTGEKTLSILRGNFYGWFENIARGIYGLSDRGREMFSEYPELVAYYQNLINNNIKNE